MMAGWMNVNAWRASVGALTMACLLAAAAPAAAAKPDPQKAQALVEDVIGRALAVLEKHSGQGQMDVEQVKQKLNEIVLPHLDLVTMTKLAVGRHWRQATREQKRTLVTEFRNLLTRTYATSLDEYQGQQVEFLPLRPSPHEDRVMVRSRVTRPEGPPVPVHYGVHYDDGQWQVYDIVVEGVSLVTTYRSSFASSVQRNGIEGLINDLKQKNASGETSPEAPGAT